MEKWLKKNRPVLILIALVIGYFVFSFATIFIKPLDQFLAGPDVRDYFFWLILYIKKQLLALQLPLWNPYVFSGHPLLANPQTAVFYPLNWLHLILPLPLSLNVLIIAHFCIAAIGMYRFCLALEVSITAAIFGGIAFALSGFFSGQLQAGHLTMVYSAAWLAWIFTALELSLQQNNRRQLLIASVFFALLILAGEPQIAWYTLIFATLYFLLRQRFYKRAFVNLSLQYALLFLLPAFGLSCLQILPTWEFASLSDRAQASYQFATFHSLPLRNLITFLIPEPNTHAIYASWENRLTLSVAGILLALIGWCTHYRKPSIWALTIVALLALSFALGKYSPLYALYYNLPGVAFFKIPARASLFILFGLSVFCALGLQTVLEKKRQRQMSYALIYFSLLLCLLITAIYLDISLHSNELKYAVSMLTLSFGMIYFYLHSQKRFALVWLSLLFLIMLMDQRVVWHPLRLTLPTSTNQLLQASTHDAWAKAQSESRRVVMTEPSLRNMYFDYKNISGYYPIMLKDYQQLLTALLKLSWNENLPRSTLSPGLFTAESLPRLSLLNATAILPEEQNNPNRLETKSFMPRAWLVNKSFHVANRKLIRERLSQSTFDPMQEVMLEDPIRLKAGQAKCQEKVQIVRERAAEIQYQVFNCQESVLVMSELYYPGWQVRVNGVDAKLLRVNADFRGLKLSAGEHLVKVFYRPPLFYAGMVVSIFSWLAVLIVLLFKRSRRKINFSWRWL